MHINTKNILLAKCWLLALNLSELFVMYLYTAAPGVYKHFLTAVFSTQQKLLSIFYLWYWGMNCIMLCILMWRWTLAEEREDIQNMWIGIFSIYYFAELCFFLSLHSSLLSVTIIQPHEPMNISTLLFAMRIFYEKKYEELIHPRYKQFYLH